MRTTVFSTPVLRPLLQAVARCLIALFGWKIVGDKPAHSKYVLIGAPHTSNWDFVLMLMFAFAKGLDVHWMGKHTLFPFPFGGVMRWLGGIAIDRRQRHGTVEQMIEHFHAREQLVLLNHSGGNPAEKASNGKPVFTILLWGLRFPSYWVFLIPKHVVWAC